jgi:AcrR family transcriptional regulator
MKRDQSTEEKIKAAAKKVFMTKGFDGCSVRDIAKEVGSNVALLNYYFRSKEKLFELIFEGAMSDFLQSMMAVFSSDLTLREKLELIIDQEFDFFMEHPELPMFILHSIQQKNVKIPMPREVVHSIANTGIFERRGEGDLSKKHHHPDDVQYALSLYVKKLTQRVAPNRRYTTQK